ncbi:hypothetical protein AB0B50_22795 [Streptomyces sp. NPDC041068]|uniref:hypothetical protein n=1 Tax=Streptomyces sp. NPDC041068 TaxID=3155130 RepID=UPI0033E1C410
MASRWSWGPDPFRKAMFLILAPGLLIAGALGGMDWTWWQRMLAGMVGLALASYVVLTLLGAWRLRRDPGRRDPGHADMPRRTHG